MNLSDPPRRSFTLGGKASQLPRITVTRYPTVPGALAHEIDAFGVDSVDKLVDAFEVRERAIAAKEWRSKSDLE